MTQNAEVIAGAVLELDRFKKSKNQIYIDAQQITAALESGDIKFLRNLSEYYDGISGIYGRLMKYLANILTYDSYAYPYLPDPKANVKIIQKDMKRVLGYLDQLAIRETFTEISYKVIKYGAFYGYMINSKDLSNGSIMELPLAYCRSRYKFKGMDAVEFNVKYFDEVYRDVIQKEIVLSSFPKEFRKGYEKYKSGEIVTDRADGGAWMLLDLNLSMRFALNDSEIPFFATVIPSIVSLDEAKQLDMKKTMQELLKIIIQKMPLDKNSELVFDIDEAKDLHNNVVQMLGNAINVDVLTTFADVEVADLDSSNSNANNDPLSKVERGVFNEAGVSQMLFATDGNMSLEKSILNDESLMFFLLGQYQNKLSSIVDFLFSNKTTYKMAFLKISIYNAEKKQKMYESLATKGYSKLLPVISSGTTQSEFLSLNFYENEILKIGEILAPLEISSTQSGDKAVSSDKKVGAPAKDEGDLAEKTIQNKESMS